LARDVAREYEKQRRKNTSNTKTCCIVFVAVKELWKRR
jgi:hypothetical protein